ncbi:hypothetical protein SAMN04515617_110103 [Collimonas sp. OK242]|jgi:peptidoglycan/LPS O-acetylase OafA/YrhL|uniref:hypothetical protein n=1 Tax=Collimonas sp. OK242 TaxID=1798195 RepID=UPI0008943F70|nr:hypothetical protein [Collimonas sp. OK242]SDY13181.1 hypothetical protein SAMN04515617_110103 [Collimonas sp. OK242]
MLELISGFVGGALAEYFRSRRTSKKKVFIVFFFLSTSVLTMVGLWVRPDEKFFNLMLAIALSLAVATLMVAVLMLDEMLEIRKKKKAEKRPD